MKKKKSVGLIRRKRRQSLAFMAYLQMQMDFKNHPFEYIYFIIVNQKHESF